MKILAATDGSHRAESAVRFAAWLASRFRNGRLEVVLVGDAGMDLIAGESPQRRVPLAMEKEYRRWAQRALERAARLASPFGVPAACRYVETTRLAPIARAISRQADTGRADLIVVGSSGRGAIGHAVFGSVARSLLGVARRPVVVVPAPVSAGARDGLRILAASDGSRGSIAAIRYAASLARKARKGGLEVVTVGTLRHDLALGSSSVLSLLRYRELRVAESDAADRILRRAAREARSARVRPTVRFLEPRQALPVADVVAREARRQGAHLVAIGTAGRSGIERWALGSVTRRLLAISRRPVLVVRTP